MSPTPYAEAIERLPIAGAFKRFLIPANLDRFYPSGKRYDSPAEIASAVLSSLQAGYLVSGADLARVPKTGPVIVVSNHPFGILEGLMLFDMLSRVRPDVKILANSLLSIIPGFRGGLILVDPFAAPGSKEANTRGLREALSFLGAGGLLIVFPAGEVSHVQIRERRIADPGWNRNVARFIRRSRATVVPIFIRGANSVTFQLLGMIHSQLRTARLLHELVNKREKTVELRIAGPIAFESLQGFDRDAEMTRYLRYRTYLLENRRTRAPHPFARLLRAPKHVGRPEPVVHAAPRLPLEAEIARLDPLAASGGLDVYLAQAGEIPHVLHEIGRLREIAFREVGEGTGTAMDLDRFDRHYNHLFLWDREAKCVVGAYRLGVTADILPRYGVEGLYTSTLFHFDAAFFDRIGPAVEMGRSFVRSEYRKQYAPLLLLWKGIGSFIARNPGHPVLFGPVSISNEYHPVSRRLIVRYLQAQASLADLAALVKPRRKFPTRRGHDDEAVSLMLRDSDELSAITGDIEPDGKGIPVLLKQYLKLGGKLLGFNIDTAFADALDGLILVDLRQTPPAILQRYMGREGVNSFLGYHRSTKDCAPAH